MKGNCMPWLALTLFGIASVAAASPIRAQTALGAQTSQDNDGLDPTSPARYAKISFEHTDLTLPSLANSDNANSVVFEYQHPFDRNAVRFKVPLTSVGVAGNEGYALGDASVKFTHVLGVTRSHGLVVNAEIVLDTAARPELGAGKTVIKPGVVYALFLKGGHIFAPALAHSLSIAGDDARGDVNSTTIDFYFVPRLANPRLYMTLDPALTHDWEGSSTYLITALTVGYKLGPMLGGKGQVFVKPSLGLGRERTADWGISVGVQLLNF